MSFLLLRPVSSNRLISLALATLLPACVAEQEPAPQGALPDVGLNPDQAAPDGGLLLPDAAVAFTAAPAQSLQDSHVDRLPASSEAGHKTSCLEIWAKSAMTRKVRSPLAHAPCACPKLSALVMI